jgi:hypothetical protein
VPLRVADSGSGMLATRAAVDSELAWLYSDILRRSGHKLDGPAQWQDCNCFLRFVAEQAGVYFQSTLIFQAGRRGFEFRLTFPNPHGF